MTRAELMEILEAVDWFEFNTLRTIPYAGVNHPIIIEP